MDRLKIQKFVNKHYNKDVYLSNTTEINSFTMGREYFLDVFEIRYEISIDIKKPINGLKEVLKIFSLSSGTSIQSTSIKSDEMDIILYTDPLFTKLYGIVDFLA